MKTTEDFAEFFHGIPERIIEKSNETWTKTQELTVAGLSRHCISALAPFNSTNCPCPATDPPSPGPTHTYPAMIHMNDGAAGMLHSPPPRCLYLSHNHRRDEDVLGVLRALPAEPGANDLEEGEAAGRARPDGTQHRIQVSTLPEPLPLCTAADIQAKGLMEGVSYSLLGRLFFAG